MEPLSPFNVLVEQKDAEGLRKLSDAKTEIGADIVAEDVDWLKEFADHLDQLLAACEKVAKNDAA
jgi:hypothetical protein